MLLVQIFLNLSFCISKYIFEDNKVEQPKYKEIVTQNEIPMKLTSFLKRRNYAVIPRLG